MRNELLELLQLEDLQGEAYELAELIGIEAYRKLVDRYGGTGRMYIPQADTLVIPLRDAKIREEYDGTNIYALCKKWELSEGYIRKIVAGKNRRTAAQTAGGAMLIF